MPEVREAREKSGAGMSSYPDTVELRRLLADLDAAPNFDAYFFRNPEGVNEFITTCTVLDAELEIVCTCPDEATADLLARFLNMAWDVLRLRASQ